jgi:hypothetical protein
MASTLTRASVVVMPVGEMSADGAGTQFSSLCPVLLRGAATEWPATTLWRERASLTKMMGGASAIVQCEESASGRFDPSRRLSTSIALTVGQVLDETLFVDGAAREHHDRPAPRARRLYCKLRLSEKLIGGLGKLPHGLVVAAGDALETRFWLGACGNETTLHFDLCHSVIAQIVGRKRVLLFPPGASASLYPFRVVDGAPRVSRVDLGAWLRGDAAECARHPNVRACAGALECTLHAGDVLYVPPGWWHHVEALDGNISVLLPFDMSAGEQRAMHRPWTSASWGTAADVFHESCASWCGHD